VSWTEMLFATAPLALVGVLAVAHALYYWAISNRSSQLTLIEPRASRHTLSQTVAYGPEIFNAQKTAADRKRQLKRQTRASARPRVFSDPVIVRGDLILDQDCIFVSALKVCEGRLVVRGHVSFNAPVVVDGPVIVIGHASFGKALFTRSDFVVRGRAICYDSVRAKHIRAEASPFDDAIDAPIRVNKK
jgi:hypothetical protein